MSIKEAIKQVVEAGGSIHHPCKRFQKQWMDNVSISSYAGKYYITGGGVRAVGGMELDEAIQAFGRVAYSRKNLANAIIGIQKHNLLPPDCDIDDIQEDQLAQLMKTYWTEFYEKDFPFANEFQATAHTRHW